MSIHDVDLGFFGYSFDAHRSLTAEAIRLDNLLRVLYRDGLLEQLLVALLHRSERPA